MIEIYSPEWPKKFAREAEIIRSALKDYILEIEHFGSTSIPGTSAKPIIDMGILVTSIDDKQAMDQCKELLKEVGYEYASGMSGKKRIVFRKGNPVEFHLSLSSNQYPWWENQILFRDYLRKHPEAVQEYEALKKHNLENISVKDLEELCWNTAYTENKSDFVTKIIDLAKSEKSN